MSVEVPQDPHFPSQDRWARGEARQKSTPGNPRPGWASMTPEQRQRHVERYGHDHRRHRELFLMENGHPPYACDWCGDQVDYDDLLVHHTVEGSNDPKHLVACHRRKTDKQKLAGEKSCHYLLDQRDKGRTE